MQPAWRLEFRRGVWIFVKFVDPTALGGGILIGGVREQLKSNRKSCGEGGGLEKISRLGAL